MIIAKIVKFKILAEKFIFSKMHLNVQNFGNQYFWGKLDGTDADRVIFLYESCLSNLFIPIIQND